MRVLGAAWRLMGWPQRAIFSVGAAAVPIGLTVAVAAWSGDRDGGRDSQTSRPPSTYGTYPWARGEDSPPVSVLPEKAVYSSSLKVAIARLDQALREVGVSDSPPARTILGNAQTVRAAFDQFHSAAREMPESSPPPASKADREKVDQSWDTLREALEDGTWLAHPPVADAYEDVYAGLYTQRDAMPDPTTNPQPDPPDPDPNRLDTVNAMVGLFGAGLGAASAAMTLQSVRSQTTSGRRVAPRARRVAGRREPPPDETASR